MNTIGARRACPPTAIAAHWRRLAAWCATALLCTSVWAQEEVPPTSAPPELMAQAFPLETEERSRNQLEVSTTSLPRFQNTDGATHSSQFELVWLPPSRSAFGLTVGLSSPSSAGMPVDFNRGSTSVNMGLRWRYTMTPNYRVDVSAWRRLVPADALSLVQVREPSYGARVEMRIGPAPIRSGFVADRGFLGFQLESGARITLRRSGGKPMVYYRTKF